MVILPLKHLALYPRNPLFTYTLIPSINTNQRSFRPRLIRLPRERLNLGKNTVTVQEIDAETPIHAYMGLMSGPLVNERRE